MVNIFIIGMVILVNILFIGNVFEENKDKNYLNGITGDVKNISILMLQYQIHDTYDINI